MKAAQEMGYVPSSAAKVVRGSPSYCVGVAIEKDLNTNRFNLVLQGIRDKMEQQGYNLMLCGFERRHGIYADYVNNALERRVDGVIFIGRDNEGPTPEAEELILRHQIPFVVYDCGLEGRPYSTVELEYEKSSFEMTCRLLAEGAKTIFYIRPDLDNYQETQREAGVHRAMSLYKNSRLIVERAPITKETMYHPDSNPNQSEDLYTARRLWPYVSQRVMPVLEGEQNLLLSKEKLGTMEVTTQLEPVLSAPVEKGQKVGTLTVTSGGEVLAELPLVASEAVERLSYGQILLRCLQMAFLGG